ncbi:MAG: hypothetical protein IH860_05020 [Chloroflexi bacterium]|nr:hypothetical protein [Chloroflexota bacterium]
MIAVALVLLITGALFSADLSARSSMRLARLNLEATDALATFLEQEKAKSYINIGNSTTANVVLSDSGTLDTSDDLTGVIVGSEGTFVIVTKIIVRLMRQPRAVKTFVAIYDDIVDASDTVSAIIGQGIVPAALEMMDNIVIRAVEPVIHAGYPLDADAVLLVEVEGMAESVEEEARAIEVICKENKATDVRVATDPQAREKLWAGRKNAFGALGSIAPNYYIVDGVVPRSKLPEVMKKVAEICRRYEVSVANVLHAGDGNLHPIILFNERDEGMKEKVLEAGGEIMRVCIDAGGALTGEHGIGIEKQMYMPWSFTEEDMDAMRRLRGAFSSAGFFNPGKIFPDEAVDGKAWELPRLVAKSSGMYV